MTDSKKPINENSFPKEKRGYQPVKPNNKPGNKPDPNQGYQPSTSGDNSTIRPKPPGNE